MNRIDIWFAAFFWAISGGAVAQMSETVKHDASVALEVLSAEISKVETGVR